MDAGKIMGTVHVNGQPTPIEETLRSWKVAYDNDQLRITGITSRGSVIYLELDKLLAQPNAFST